MDMTRRVNLEEFAMRALFGAPKPLVRVNPGTSSRGPGDKVEEEEEQEQQEDMKAEGEVEEGAMGYTQCAFCSSGRNPKPPNGRKLCGWQPRRVSWCLSSLWTMLGTCTSGTQSHVYGEEKIKGKKLYGNYTVEETIAISSEDEDDIELAKRLRSNPPSPIAFAGMVRVKPEVLTVKEANEKMWRDKEQRVHLQKAAVNEPSVQNEVAELSSLMLEQERQKAMAQPPSSADLISQVIQGMWAQGLVVAPSSSFPYLPPAS